MCYLSSESELKLSAIEKEVISSLCVKSGRKRDRASTDYRELTYWYEAMFSFILWNEYTVKSSSLEKKNISINKTSKINVDKCMDSIGKLRVS